MSARALLLSPDDQAVTAITGVLEELSVLCERPHDGATAAQKLNSQTYDLVLVDCDNLPAAKLIFDVCRRSNAGTTVPIAIVDGRAGLPTAFRLGAELILTKPVAKDQARTTIRTAVSRLRKEVHNVEAPAIEPLPGIPEPRAQAAAAGAVSNAPASTPTPPAEATHVAEVSPALTTAATEQLKAAVKPAQTASQTIISPIAASTPHTDVPVQPKKLTPALSSFENAAFKPIPNPPEKAAHEELTKAETELPTPITFSSFDQSKKRSKGQGALVALVILGMGAAGFYAAWTTQPDFRAMVKPQLEKAMTMAAGLYPGKKAVPAPSAPLVAKAPAPQPVAPGPTATSPTTEPAAATSTTTAPDNAPPTTADSASTATDTPQTATPSDTVRTTTTEDAEKAPENPPAKAAKTSASAESELSWEKDTVILSSKGAEKRLVHHVQPTLPKSARGQKADGTVVLKTLVGGNGSVQGVRLVEGNPALATAATKAVKQWRYKPYMRNGARTSFQTIVIVDFQQP